MPSLAIHRLPMAHPGDVSALTALIDRGAVAAGDIRAVIGKTEGNGGLNDFTRGFFTQTLMLLLARETGQDLAALAARIPCVLSGGTEGALSPHFLLFAVDRAAGGARGLALGTAFSPPTPAEQIGRDSQIEAVAQAVRDAMADAGIARAADVALVQVKAPCAQAPGPGARAGDPRLLMALSRAAAAFGVGRALGDIPEGGEDALLRDRHLFSNRVSISSGIEVVANEVVVFGQADGWAPGLTAGVAPMADLLDLPGVCAAFRAAGLEAAPAVPAAQRGRVLGVIAKGEPDAAGAIRGARHTMLGDTDLDAQRHLRGALGAIVASVAGDGQVFVSGGAEHQGPPGGGLVCVFARD
ncbi:cyanuric acid amidohydrolase [Falsiroseomonas selenitidurans]|uniref:Cyclic amide hydrolase n=1 Tax=Falsiroseomonas selenitidurans TaxID=2716335 RepID=A0ABX1E3X0_9PROT|nr:ring-opening amidohydrolase [Falsiroseomonas selenitidurans]NKC29620.1 ring-opening amidohydrolase [Falsiroseomonas selenitidurans]